MISTLTYSTLFPNCIQTRHGIFVRNRLHHLLETGGVNTQVVAPVPWFPFKHARFGAYSEFARVPPVEQNDHYPVLHPRYPLIPKIGMTVTPYLLAWRSLPACKRIVCRFTPDLIDAHYFYPDGVAAIMLGRWLDLPVVITARGTDINLIPRYPGPRRMILAAAQKAAAIITVCAALKDALLELAGNQRHLLGKKITVLRNGVNLQHFTPLDKAASRQRLGFSGRTLLSVGHLVERKGHHIVIDALRQLPDSRLVIVGDGDMEHALRNQVMALGLQARVHFAGHVSHQELPYYYSAADALVLASSREGWANVLLESMACGTPVIATAVWGTTEVVADPVAGVLMKSRDPAALAQAAHALFGHYPQRTQTRGFAENFSWHDTSVGQIAVFQKVLKEAH